MLSWRGLDGVPAGWGRCVVTIGVFDGVHRGHQILIRRAIEVAKERDLPTVLMTFDPHPAEVVRPGSHPARLTTLQRRAELVAELGVDVFCVMPFTPDLSRTPADEFAHEILVDGLHAAAAVVGRNFTFGHKAKGDVELLSRLGRKFGFVAEGIDLVSDAGIDHGDITFSSTFIRACIDAGDVETATIALGRPHRVDGVVVHGERRGRSLGFPTANIDPVPYAAVPADGVYAGLFAHRDRQLPAAISVGSNPTFSGRERRIEAYVLDVEEDFYGHHVGIDFVHRLRGMERFADIKDLIAQMRRDVERTRELLTD